MLRAGAQKRDHGSLSLADLSMELDWSSPSLTFPLLLPLIARRVYTRAVFSGIIVSAGGLTESVVRPPCPALRWETRHPHTLADRCGTRRLASSTRSTKVRGAAARGLRAD